MVIQRRMIAILRSYIGVIVLPLIITVTITGIGFALLFGLIARLSAQFAPNDLGFYFGNRELLPLLLGAGMGVSYFGALIGLARTDRIAELLFSTPLSVKAFMFSLWLALLFACIMVIYSVQGVFVFVAGIERLADLPPLIWIQPLPLAITWVSAGGLLAITQTLESSLRKKTVYVFIVFIPLLALVALAIMSIIITLPEIGLAELLPAAVLEAVPSFMHCYGARWLPAAIYALGWFFLLSRKIPVRNFICPERLSLPERIVQRIHGYINQ